jgi:F0F1-type ATP synthase membrane subunit c/vacuolar-type H+-ATPase subunit K
LKTKAGAFWGKTFSSLKVPNYRLYFTGQSISMVGTWMQMTAQSWLVLTLTHSSTDLGLTVALQAYSLTIMSNRGRLRAGPGPGRLVTAAVNAAGRKPRGRAVDLMIAATAVAEGLPLYTTNPADFTGLDALIPISRHRPACPHEQLTR